MDANPKRVWSDSSRRVKRWRARQGVLVQTFLSATQIEGIKKEAERRQKPRWRLIRAAICYGLATAVRRGW